MLWEEVWGLKPISHPNKVSNLLGKEKNKVLEFLSAYNPNIMDLEPLNNLVDCYALLGEQARVSKSALKRLDSLRQEDGSYSLNSIPVYSIYFVSASFPPTLKDTYSGIRAVKRVNSELSDSKKTLNFVLSKYDESKSNSEDLFIFTSLFGLLDFTSKLPDDLHDEIIKFQTNDSLFSSRYGSSPDPFSTFYCLASLSISGRLNSVDLDWPTSYFPLLAKKFDLESPYLHILSSLDLLGQKAPDSWTPRLLKEWKTSSISPFNKLRDNYNRLSSIYLL